MAKAGFSPLLGLTWLQHEAGIKAWGLNSGSPTFQLCDLGAFTRAQAPPLEAGRDLSAVDSGLLLRLQNHAPRVLTVAPRAHYLLP